MASRFRMAPRWPRTVGGSPTAVDGDMPCSTTTLRPTPSRRAPWLARPRRGTTPSAVLPAIRRRRRAAPTQRVPNDANHIDSDAEGKLDDEQERLVTWNPIEPVTRPVTSAGALVRTTLSSD